MLPLNKMVIWMEQRLLFRVYPIVWQKMELQLKLMKMVINQFMVKLNYLVQPQQQVFIQYQCMQRITIQHKNQILHGFIRDMKFRNILQLL